MSKKHSDNLPSSLSWLRQRYTIQKEVNNGVKALLTIHHELPVVIGFF